MNGKKAKALRRMMADQPAKSVAQSAAEVALARLRKSGLFELDMESWVDYFHEKPEVATPGFVNYVIAQRKAELRHWSFTVCVKGD